ncbi:MAG: phosphoribosyltransferase family protein [Acidimicrobiia bacterium]
MAYYFHDRRDAGQKLAQRLAALRGERPVVLGLPRGGIPVAYEVARALGAPLDVLIVRKLGLPQQPELGMGAIGEGGARVLNPDVLVAGRVTEREFKAVEARESVEVERRARRYRGDRPMTSLRGRVVVIVDDGLATGSTARAAVQVARKQGAARVILGVPVAPPEAIRDLENEADEVVALYAPKDFRALGTWYGDFSQTPDEEVIDLLHRAADRSPDASPTETKGITGAPARDGEVTIDASGVRLTGHLTLPEGATGVVLFAHGSGSSRHSPRNIAVARLLNRAGLGTLLFDLLSHAEATDRANVFDVGLLAERLHAATTWLHSQPGCRELRVGYFGASTGAAAALRAAAAPNADIDAVVSRGGRPDLAGPQIVMVRAPTLLIVGGLDHPVIAMNREAERQLTCEHRLEIVPGATHLFDEPGTLAKAAELAAAWFVEHLGNRQPFDGSLPPSVAGAPSPSR